MCGVFGRTKAAMSSTNDSNEASNANRWPRMRSCLDSFGLLYRIVDSVVLFAVLSVQNYWLSYYVTYFNAHNKGWYFFFFADSVLTLLFICGAAFASGYYKKLHVLKHLKRTTLFSSSSDENKSETNRIHAKHSSEKHQIFGIRLPQCLGTLPLLWICWVLYSLLMSTKIFLIHLQNIALQLYQSTRVQVFLSHSAICCQLIQTNPKTEPLGALDGALEAEPHTVKLCLATMTVVFVLWIELHRNQESNQSIECIRELTTTVVFEIFDSIDLLDLLLPESFNDKAYDPSLSKQLSVVILLLAAMNLLLPTIGLFRLSQTSFDSHRLGLRMNILHNCLRIAFVNIPYMLVRISFWLTIKREISIFLLKNALFVFVSIRHIITEVHELKQLQKSKERNDLALNGVSDALIRKVNGSGDQAEEQ